MWMGITFRHPRLWFRDENTIWLYTPLLPYNVFKFIYIFCLAFYSVFLCNASDSKYNFQYTSEIHPNRF